MLVRISYLKSGYIKLRQRCRGVKLAVGADSPLIYKEKVKSGETGFRVVGRRENGALVEKKAGFWLPVSGPTQSEESRFLAPAQSEETAGGETGP